MTLSLSNQDAADLFAPCGRLKINVEIGIVEFNGRSIILFDCLDC